MTSFLDLADYAAAQPALDRAPAADRSVTNRAATHTLLAQIAFLKGDYAAAQTARLDTLPLSLRVNSQFITVQARCNTVEILYVEGHRDQALALVGLMKRQPAWSNEDTDWLNTLLRQWELDPEKAAAEMAGGDALDWDTTIPALLDQVRVVPPKADRGCACG